MIFGVIMDEKIISEIQSVDVFVLNDLDYIYRYKKLNMFLDAWVFE